MSVKVKKPYALSEFGLSGVSTRRHLAQVLLAPLPTLRKLQKLGDKAYRVKQKRKKNSGKLRETHDPQPDLKKIQRRINFLLQRVAHPAYLQAGLSGECRGYIHNGKSHSAYDVVTQLDIQSFFTNCRREYVYQFFASLGCSADVCQLVTDLTTYAGHLPTGGPASLLLAYWIHRETFEAIVALATREGLKVTVYVDDFTFSGKRISDSFMNEVKCLLVRVGLKGHKQKYSKGGAAKVITGVAITTQGPKLPFRRSKQIKEGYQSLGQATSDTEKLQHLDPLISRLSEASRIEDHYKKKLQAMKNVRRELKRRCPAKGATTLKRPQRWRKPSGVAFQRMISVIP